MNRQFDDAFECFFFKVMFNIQIDNRQNYPKHVITVSCCLYYTYMYIHIYVPLYIHIHVDKMQFKCKYQAVCFSSVSLKHAEMTSSTSGQFVEKSCFSLFLVIFDHFSISNREAHNCY
jgi:hypothetical protein